MRRDRDEGWQQWWGEELSLARPQLLRPAEDSLRTGLFCSDLGFVKDQQDPRGVVKGSGQWRLPAGRSA